MHASIFKKYDIRGIVHQELAIDQVYRLTKAIVHYFKMQNPELKTIVVGMDGRTHSPAIKDHVCNAIIDSGTDVVFIGTCPTPLFYFANETLDVQAGIMITASHNPKAHNGFKLVLNKKSVFDQEIVTIKNLFFSDLSFSQTRQKGFFSQQNIIPTYVNILAHQFKHLQDQPVPVIIDCAHGATAAIIPTLVQVMGWNNAQLMYATVDGEFPAHEADPTKEENMHDLRQELRMHPGFFGVSFDGDGDRFAAITEDGLLVRGEELIAIFCKEIHEQQGQFTLVTDIKCANAIVNQLRDWQLQQVFTPCGIGFIRAAMRKHKALFGGEISCHYCFADRYFGFDDGIYAMMRLIEILVKAQVPLQAHYDALPARFYSPELRLSCDNEQKFSIVESIKQQLSQRPEIQLNVIDGIRAEFPYGCATIRPSNTEAVVSARFEGSTPQNLDLLIDEFYMMLVPHFDRTYLRSVLKKDL